MQQSETVNLKPQIAAGRDLPAEGDFLVNLEFFSGPMDLLLHLVEQQEVEIEHVDLTAVCNQYLKIVEHSAELDLERRGVSGSSCYSCRKKE